MRIFFVMMFSKTIFLALMTFVDSVDRPILSGGPLQKECIFEQLHFHWAEDDQGGSEHSIDGIK